MIVIEDKKACCGCWACVQRCPQNCITMHEDKEGFSYPVADPLTCIECGLCEKVCPVLNRNSERVPSHAYLAMNANEPIRRQSSSGGIFTSLAEAVIAADGVVFGAKCDEQGKVVHDFTETKDGLSAFRGSKYVQSRIGDSFKNAERFLKARRKVLFTGTPCQIAGLKNYLQREYDNLLTVDFVCHGVPSPAVWNAYLKELGARLLKRGKTKTESPEFTVRNISFRDKQQGWVNYGLKISFHPQSSSGEAHDITYISNRHKDPYLRGFAENLFLRPSCHHCPARNFRSRSDTTIADAWGLSATYPQLNDDLGCSLAFIHSSRIKIEGVLCEVDYTMLLPYNPSIECDDPIPDRRERFFQDYRRIGALKSLKKHTKGGVIRFRTLLLYKKIGWNIKRIFR